MMRKSLVEGGDAVGLIASVPAGMYPFAPVSTALLPAASRMVPPLSATALLAASFRSVVLCPAATVYLNASALLPEPDR